MLLKALNSPEAPVASATRSVIDKASLVRDDLMLTPSMCLKSLNRTETTTCMQTRDWRLEEVPQVSDQKPHLAICMLHRSDESSVSGQRQADLA